VTQNQRNHTETLCGFGPEVVEAPEGADDVTQLMAFLGRRV
jgi:hypothetical protein